MRKFFILGLLLLSLMGSCLFGAGEIFLQNQSGSPAEQTAVQVGGAGSANRIPSLDSSGRLDNTMMPIGTELAAAVSVVCSENLAAGAFVNLYSNAGTINARNANATTNGLEAHGFVLQAYTSGATVVVYTGGLNTACTGLTVGSRYWLGTTAGTYVATAPSATGNLVQILGVALTATTMVIKFQTVCTKA